MNFVYINISAYSIVSAVLFYNLALIAVYLLRRKKEFMLRYGTTALILLSFLAVLRLCLPIEFGFSHVVGSDTVLPAIRDSLIYCPFGENSISIGTVLLLVWAAGSSVFLVRDIFLLVKGERKRGRYVPAEDEIIAQAMDELGLKHQVIISCDVPMPMVAGLFRPVIYLPKIELSTEQWKYVLRHEARHIDSRDLFIKLFYILLRTVMWWNPVSHLFLKEIDILLELRCDTAIVKSLDEEERRDYLDAILQVIKNTMPAKENILAVAGLTGSVVGLKQRFESVLQFEKRSSIWRGLLIYALLTVLFLASYLVVLQPRYEPPAEDLEYTYTVYNETSFILYTGGEYWLFIDNKYFSKIPEEELKDAPLDSLPIFGTTD